MTAAIIVAAVAFLLGLAALTTSLAAELTRECQWSGRIAGYSFIVAVWAALLAILMDILK